MTAVQATADDRLVDEKGDLAVGGGNGKGQGIGADHRYPAADRGNGGARIGEAEGDETLARQIAGVKAERCGIVGIVHGKPGNAVFAGRRNQLGETFLDCRVGEAVPGIGAKRDGRQPLHRRSGPAVHLAAVEMAQINWSQ